MKLHTKDKKKVQFPMFVWSDLSCKWKSFNTIVIANSKKISDYQTNKLETKKVWLPVVIQKKNAVYKAWPNWNNPGRESVGYKGRRKIV